MADIALDSHPDMIPSLFAEWSRYPTSTPDQWRAREDYARREMERVRDLGIAPFYAAMSAPLADQQDAAVRALKAMGMGSVPLRLREGVEPPAADHQGRVLRGEDKGKLRAKVGNIQIDRGPIRLDLGARGGDLYRSVDITRDALPVSLEEAVLVWRQWGYRYRSEEMRGSQCTWLVVHVRQDGKPYGAPTTDSKPKR